jgi:aspartate racemase
VNDHKPTGRAIGVLGGIGPQATMDFEARLHRVAQRRLPQAGNRGYPPLVTVYMRHPPVRVGPDQLPLKPLQLDPRLLDAARKLGAWVDLIAIPSNTPHFFLEQIAEAAGCPVLDMVGLAVEALLAGGDGAVGLVGLGIPRVYDERLKAAGLRVITADAETIRALDRSIIGLMEGRCDERDRNAARAAVAQVRAAGAPRTVLGCTEIPLLLGADADAADLVNPGQLLAEAAVDAAIG